MAIVIKRILKDDFIMELNFEEMQVYDFSNINLQEESNANCFCNSCDHCNSCVCHSGCHSSMS